MLKQLQLQQAQAEHAAQLSTRSSGRPDTIEEGDEEEEEEEDEHNDSDEEDLVDIEALMASGGK